MMLDEDEENESSHWNHRKSKSTKYDDHSLPCFSEIRANILYLSKNISVDNLPIAAMTSSSHSN